MSETYTGVLTELGGPEIGQSGNEKPRKVIVKQDVAKQYGKVFRVWSGDDLWDELQGFHGKPVTIEYDIEERQGPKGAYNQNLIVGVQPVDTTSNGEGGGGDWSVPTPGPVWGSAGSEQKPIQSPPPSSKDDYWERREAADERRTYEIEAAWALHTILSVEGPDHSMSDDEQLSRAMTLILLKRRLASELAK